LPLTSELNSFARPDGIRALMDTVGRKMVPAPPLLSIVIIVGALPNLV